MHRGCPWSLGLNIECTYQLENFGTFQIQDQIHSSMSQMLLGYSSLPFCSQCTGASKTFPVRSPITQSMSRICLEHSNSSCSQWARYTWDILSVCHEENCILVMFLSFWVRLISSWYSASLRPSRICSEILLNYPSSLRYLCLSLKLRPDLTLRNVMICPPLSVQIVKYAFVIGFQSNSPRITAIHNLIAFYCSLERYVLELIVQ
jgi:hypothetical protein